MITTCLEANDKPYKRPMDIVILVLSHVVLLPVWGALWMLIPLAIWLEDRGPVFYRQKRMGKHGEVFELLKFRSLVPNADEMIRPWEVPEGRVVTRIGKILRPTALDELPQILSILKGDMSFFGPRAMPVVEYEEYVKKLPELQRRLSVRPGLTGLAQVQTRATRDNAEKLRYDLEYIDRMNPWLDLTLLGMSIWNTLLAKWEPSGSRKARHPQTQSQGHMSDSRED